MFALGGGRPRSDLWSKRLVWGDQGNQRVNASNLAAWAGAYSQSLLELYSWVAESDRIVGINTIPRYRLMSSGDTSSVDSMEVAVRMGHAWRILRTALQIVRFSRPVRACKPLGSRRSPP
jgi:hypothetical protein